MLILDKQIYSSPCLRGVSRITCIVDGGHWYGVVFVAYLMSRPFIKNLSVMILEIEDNKTITEFQEEFTIRFPYLKIEIFASPTRRIAEENVTPFGHRTVLGKVRSKHNPGAVELFPWSKARNVEDQLSRRFGLNAHIYRLQGKEWVKITGTDELTLKEQNEIGRSASIIG